MWANFIEVFDTTDKMAILISAISAFIASISTIVAIHANRMNHKQYCKSIEPQLSMELVNFNNILYLQIKNTGKTVANNIRIIPEKLTNNGDENDLPCQNGLFSMFFELYPDEVVQTEVGYWHNTIQCKSFPQLTLSVKYSQESVRKPIAYKRTVTFAPAYNNKILADVNIDTNNIASSLRHISRATVRTANYLDGHQIAEFDELDILAGKSLSNDLNNALGKDGEQIFSREETIKQTLKSKT